MLCRDMEDFKKTQIEYLEMKSTTSEIKNTLNGINYRVDKKR